ncbi:hypothetical protein SAY87_011662 [Trapa incisa]|uniref:Uncharacterized protein n=1 Tax=Trapa incisa TaxID=236973 RepID=A0AAN7GLG9_9MYRT|nr:hypothetical protein SAY87_011662 [Trapa incisa]
MVKALHLGMPPEDLAAKGSWTLTRRKAAATMEPVLLLYLASKFPSNLCRSYKHAFALPEKEEVCTCRSLPISEEEVNYEDTQRYMQTIPQCNASKSNQGENRIVNLSGGRVLTKLHHMINIAREMFDVMDEDEENEETCTRAAIFKDMLCQCTSASKTTCPSPDTPSALSTEFSGDSFYQPFLLQHLNYTD